METEGSETNKKPSRKLVGEWLINAWNAIDEQIVKNAWKKKGYEW